ncbi:CobW family GTP-binding protein [Clostridium formicaceticum]|uniref:GTP-binding protein YjiA n=1 Tax=Clostridium formicaceticum TaxID=1497 RepID=A0AAC9WHV1_9CLOT|nr:GTP-binding protein [Clostridium formicaceticum]AOY74948.1 hypothetical protein BJL90_02610 [Clostridium formicaceticum]ARE89356.1 putative GTP-binding protein YjiA [Clostridium formicaceticum]
MIKLDIISGFLGAGKTTFIKRLLQAFEKEEEKVVIVINEFGDVGIDGDLVQQEDYELYEITKGCLCCSLKEDFASTLLKIAEDIVPDRVVLEPSGIFVIQEAIELLAQERLADKYKINNLITIVDSIYFTKHDHPISLFLEKQILSASKLVLSKVQYIKEEEKKKVIHQLKQINPKAQVYKEPWHHYSNEDILEILGHIQCDYGRLNKKEASKLKHHYDHYSIKTDRVFDRASVMQLMEEVIEGRYGKVIRSKGVLLGRPDNIVFQYIDGTYDIEIFENDIEKGKMIFIGESIEKEALMNKI